MYQDVQRDIMRTHRNVILTGDLIFVNWTPFLGTQSRGIQFGTIEKFPSTKILILLACIRVVITIYKKIEFRVRHLLIHNQFEPITGSLTKSAVELNILAAQKHVPAIERFIWTVKERTRSIYNSPPFTSPTRITIEMAQRSIYWLNIFIPWIDY